MATAPRLKIGFVFDDSLDKPDGVQQYILAVGGWLSAQGHEVHYLVGQTLREDLANVSSLSRNIKVRFNGNRLTIPLPARKSAIRALLQREQFDVLHVQVPYSPWLAQRIILAAPTHTTVIGTFHIAPHSRIVTWGTKALAVWTRRSLKRFNSLVAVSPAAARFAKQTYGLSMPVLPNVVDFERFHNAKPLPAYDDSKLTILFLGRLVPRKGCAVLLQAVALLNKRSSMPDFRVLVCGKGPLEADLKTYARQNGIQDKVEFVGFIDEADKPSYYAAADISVFPSSAGESFGIVLLEAMASGRSVVLAGNNEGYASVMEPQPNLLFEPRDAAKLADLLEHYAVDIKARQQMAAWGSDYTPGFDTAVVGNKLVELYNQTLPKRKQP